MFLARVSWPILILEFALAAFAWSGFVALLFAFGLGTTTAETADFSVAEWWTQAVFLTLGFPSSAVLPSVVEVDGSLANLMGSVGGLVLPALFTAAIVLKLFVSPDLLVFRPKVSLTNWAKESTQGAVATRHLAVRCYSSTQFRLLDIQFAAVLRYETTSDDGAVVLRHQELEITNPRFPIAPHQIPITVMLPLGGEDVIGSKDQLALNGLQGFKIGSRSLLVLVATGTIPELGSDFTETYDFVLPDDFSRRSYVSIDFNGEANSWTGWEKFDD